MLALTGTKRLVWELNSSVSPNFWRISSAPDAVRHYCHLTCQRASSSLTNPAYYGYNLTELKAFFPSQG